MIGKLRKMLRRLRSLKGRKPKNGDLEAAARMLQILLRMYGVWSQTTADHERNQIECLIETTNVEYWEERFPRMNGFPVHWTGVSEPV